MENRRRSWYYVSFWSLYYLQHTNLFPFAATQIAPKSTAVMPIGIYFKPRVAASLFFRGTVREAMSLSTIARTHIETSGRSLCETMESAMVLPILEARRKLPPCLTKPCLKSRRFCSSSTPTSFNRFNPPVGRSFCRNGLTYK